MKTSATGTLRIIVDKFDILQSFAFFEHVVDIGLGFRAVKDVDADTFTVDFSFPDDEKTHAFVNTLRQFTIENQPHSFHSLTNLFKEPALSTGWKQAAQDIRNRYYKYLDDFPPMVKDLWGPRPKHREIFKVVVYGDVVKADNSEYREKFVNWTKDDIRSFVLKQEFAKVLLGIYAFIAELAEISAKELGEQIG